MAQIDVALETTSVRGWPMPAIGISSCLLGQAVRFDAGHKRDRFIADRLAWFVHCVPRCPEMAIGLGAPREPLHLLEIDHRMGARGVRSAASVGDSLRRHGTTEARALHGLCGYLFKANSPSCGLYQVPVYTAGGQRTNRHTRGLYAGRITAAMPWLPVEEADRLHDAALRDNFLVRVFTLDRLQRAVLADTPAARALVDFHTHHKSLLMAHNVAATHRLGRLAARAGNEPLDSLIPQYRDDLMAALMRPARTARHINVLQHLLGSLRRRLDSDDRAEILAVIDTFRAGHLPWIAVRVVLRHHFRRYHDGFIDRQVYLEPYPDELAAAGPV